MAFNGNAVLCGGSLHPRRVPPDDQSHIGNAGGFQIGGDMARSSANRRWDAGPCSTRISCGCFRQRREQRRGRCGSWRSWAPGVTCMLPALADSSPIAKSAADAAYCAVFGISPTTPRTRKSIDSRTLSGAFSFFFSQVLLAWVRTGPWKGLSTPRCNLLLARLGELENIGRHVAVRRHGEDSGGEPFPIYLTGPTSVEIGLHAGGVIGTPL